ncbi:hypothetical protein FACS1894130_11780 [Spirochaetia bacterium]|nr:hypothetical protein FACS1894130_11780 [Spirochaetia bacterium]
MVNIIEQLGFYRLVHVSDNQNLSDDELAVVEQAKEFDIDSVYFCKDEKRSYPALFLKKVTEFDNNTLKTLAEIQRKIWNYKKILFLYVYTDTEIRIYNCVQKPLIKKSNTDYGTELSNFEIMTATNADTKKLNVLHNLFSAIAIDTGIIWTLEEASKIRERLNIKARVDKYLVNSLINTTTKLLSAGLDISIIHKIMLRSLFLLYLEDRGATDSKFYGEIKPQATSYFEILNDVKYTYELYGKLEHHFNGSLFTITDDEYKKVKDKHLQLIKKCFTYGDDGVNQDYLPFGERIFDFKIIQIELLSEIYESFLAAMEPGERHQTGTFYTPPPLVEFILNEKLPIDSKEKVYNIKILDPACGSGIFLVESFKRWHSEIPSAKERIPLLVF